MEGARTESMEREELTETTRSRLVALLQSADEDPERLTTRLRDLRRLERIAAFSGLLEVLAHVRLPEEQAEELLDELLRHRGQLRERLRRDPGLPVAAIDYLSNVRRLLRNPTVIEQSELEDTRRFAVTDVLTGLRNRRYFDGALEIEVRRSYRYGQRLTLLMLDLDDFKPVNDRHGHPFGDLVLRRTGELIRQAVRDSDVAARFGGEEFTVILPETDRLGAFALAERIRRFVEEDFADRALAGRSVPMTLSGGIATFPDDGEEADALVARADKALYLAKTLGKNRIVLFHSERRREVRYPARMRATAWLADQSPREPTRARAINLSRCGALLSARRECRTADPVEVTLGGESRDWVIPGRVVRVEESRRSRSRIAIAFDRPIPEECLRSHVRRRSRRRMMEQG